MVDATHVIDSPEQIAALAGRIRRSVTASRLSAPVILEALEKWSTALGGPDTSDIPGVAFLRMWLRRATLEPILTRELGQGALRAEWTSEGLARLKPFPLGVVGHWPAGNVEIQPVLSMTCALLGGNGCLVRVPRALVSTTRRLLRNMVQSDSGQVLTDRVAALAFDHARRDLQEAMAGAVDGAMIWGGHEAVLNVRSLPFPHWARLAVFGPRISVAAMDAEVWGRAEERPSWCLRLARDVWQFDQQACSSPQVLFLERKKGHSSAEFLRDLQETFRAENRVHPRESIQAAMTSSICHVRASWLWESSENSAFFPLGPDWTILVGAGSSIPRPTQGKTLTVLEVDDLFEPISRFDGSVQTLGLGIKDTGKEDKLAEAAAARGVDRIVKLGRMHTFSAPWDGVDLIRPMVRMVRQVRSSL
jgi:hypothetical protein